MRIFALLGTAAVALGACATDLTDEEVQAIAEICEEERAEMDATVDERIAQEAAEQECNVTDNPHTSETIRDAMGGN